MLTGLCLELPSGGVSSIHPPPGGISTRSGHYRQPQPRMALGSQIAHEQTSVCPPASLSQVEGGSRADIPSGEGARFVDTSFPGKSYSG